MDSIRRRNEWYRLRGIQFLLVMVPNKETVYPEMVPDRLHRGATTHLDQIATYFRSHGEPFAYLDLRAALTEAKEQGLVYYRTDSHWTAWGAFVGYREIMKRLTAVLPGLEPLTLEDYEFASKHVKQGLDVAALLGIPELYPEGEVPILKRRFPTRVVKVVARRGGDDVELPAHEAARAAYRSFITSNRIAAPNALFIRDSCTNALFPYMVETFYRCGFLTGQAPLFKDASAHQVEALDVVIVIWAERALNLVGSEGEDFLPG